MVETEFSIIRFRGNKEAADKVYEGLQPCEHAHHTRALYDSSNTIFCKVTGQDIAEEIVWAASRPPHVNIASTLVFPVNQASATVKYQAPKQ